MDEAKSRPRPRKGAKKAAVNRVATAKAVPAKRPGPASPPGPADHESRIRTAAYLRAERRGFAPGYEIEDWLAAEAEVRGGDPARPAAKPRKSAARKSRAS